MRTKKLLPQIFIITLSLFILVSLSFGQIITGKITGVVTDEEGKPLPGVTVEASSPSLMGIQTDVTSAKGTYHFGKLAPGTYKLVFLLDGFQKLEYKNIKVTINSIRLNIIKFT